MNSNEQLEQVQNELLCGICCDFFNRASTMSCSHSFCHSCIKEWRKNNNNCPICRQLIYSMTPSRALDNMVAALNGNNMDSRLDHDLIDPSPLGLMRPATSSDSIIVNEDEYDIQSIESDNYDYISDNNSYISDDFGSYLFGPEDEYDLLHEESNDTDLDHNDEEIEDDIFSVSTEPNDIINFEDSDNDSIYTNFFHSLATDVTIRHRVEF